MADPLREACKVLYPLGWARILDTAQLTLAERYAIREIKIALKADNGKDRT